MRRILFILYLIGIVGIAKGQGENLVDYVNTLQGTDSHWGLSYGNTYPTIGLPFGQHYFSPQTGKNGDGWKYQYEATAIRGFQQVHQCSPWMNDYAVFSLMPVFGELIVDEHERASSFSHENEIARPHYYKVSFDNGVTTEISPVERGAHMRFSFPEGGDAYVILDGYTEESEVLILPEERKVIGWVNNGRFVPENFRNYFVIQFDMDFESFGTWESAQGTVQQNATALQGKGAGAYLKFKKGVQVQAKVASSFIDPAQAKRTLNRELGAFKTLEQTKKEAEQIWNALLGRVKVEGGTEEELRTFYSCLFRANLFSRKFYERNEDNEPYYYSPYDGKVYEGYMYTDNGFWDTFRGQFPLSNILHPTMQGRYMQSLLDAQVQSGWMPTWSNPGMSGVMIGNHAISLLADAWVKGIRTFDPVQALEAYYHESTNKGPMGGSNGREGWKDYFTKGFVPYGEVHESTAKTLEYAYDDFCAYQLADAIGNEYYKTIFSRQMYNYKNVFDTSTGFVRGRLATGEWMPDFDPIEWGGPFTEANAWQYTWSVLHDPLGLVNLMGGKQAFVAKLDSFFTMPSDFKVGTYGKEIHEMTEMVMADMGQYAHGNQPVMHVPFLYSYIGQPWKTQHRVREVMHKLYNSTERGYPGDEDQGQMSSWYVLNALGFYSVCPGTDQYVLGSPIFKKATITLEDGKTFTIEAEKNSIENIYIQSATLNGENHTKNWIHYSDIINGGVLKLEMDSQPNTQRGTSPKDQPFSLSNLIETN